MRDRFGIDATVGGDRFLRDLHDRQDRRAEEFVNIEKLPDAGSFGVDHVVGEDGGEGLQSDQFAGAEYGVTKSAGLFLAGIGDIDQI